VISETWQMSDTWILVAVVVLLVLSGFLAMSETSLTRMSKSRARSLREQHRRGGHALVSLTERPEKFLNPLLLLVLICQLVSATLVGILANRLFGAAGVIIATVAEVVVIFVAFEAIPKNYAVSHPDRSALVAAPVVAKVLAFWPLAGISWLLESVASAVMKLIGQGGSGSRVTEDEVLALADVAAEDDAIESAERNFIHSVIEFGDTIVREVMVPRTDIVEIGREATVREALDLAIETGRSRIPVTGEGIDDIVGMVNLRHLARLVANGQGHEAVGASMGEANFVPETKRVASLLVEVRNAKSHLFVVVDEYGGTVGLVTLEDILEELVGEITDESDPDEVDAVAVEQRIEEGIEIRGRVNIDDANEEFGLALPSGSWDTVGGLVMDLAGGVPVIGQSVATDHYQLTVVEMDGRRVELICVEPVVAS
jgi:putative hemolysin